MFNPKIKNILMILLGSAILAFGLYNVHSMSGVTEGGILGLTLLIKHWFNISPAWSGFILNAVCYIIGFKILGRSFMAYSAVAGVGFSVFYFIFEQFGPLWQNLSDAPFLAAILGALFVGVGVGLCVRAGGAPSGDDALAMSVSKAMRIDIRIAYLVSDVLVLLLSVSYIDIKRLLFSALTVILSGQLVGLFQKR